MFQKRHYIVLAKLLKDSPNLESFKESLINILKYDNERFSETRFRKASETWQQFPSFLLEMRSCYEQLNIMAS